MRAVLAVVRLVLLVVLLYALIVAAGLLRRAGWEAGVGLGPHLAPAGSAPVSFLGVTVQLDQLTDHDRKARLEQLHSAGFGWVRQRFDWARLEPQRGLYDWASADDLIAAIRSAGLQPVVVLDGSPAWARAPADLAPTDNPLAPPADPADFARFASAFAHRYGDQVHIYQLWDEPNIAPHWGNRHIEPVGYAQLLKTASSAIRNADAQAVILTAALAPTTDRGHTALDEPYFLQRLLAAGAAPAFDAVAIEPFGFGHTPAFSTQQAAVLSFQRALLIRRTLVAAGLGDKPIWAARFGWNRLANPWWGSVTPEQQAQYTAAALDLAWQRWPWLAAMAYVIDQPAAKPRSPEWGFALTEPSGRPAPVARTIQDWTLRHTASARPATAQGWNLLDLPAGLAWRWLLVGLGAVLIAWRAAAAARVPPWRRWLAAYAGTPAALRCAVWAGWLVAYYLAAWPPLIALCWLVGALLALIEPQGMLMLAALLLPFYYQHKDVALVNYTLSVAPASAALLMLAPALLLRLQRRQARLQALDWVVLAWLGISLLPAVHVWQWMDYASGLLELVVVPAGLWLAVRILVEDGDSQRRVTVALFAGGVLAAVWGLVDWLWGAGTTVDGVRRLVGPHYSPNHTALYLVRSLFVGLGVALALQRWQRWSALGGLALVVLALVLTGSRGALLLGLPAGLLVFGWFGLGRRPGLLSRLPGSGRWRWAAGAAVLLAVMVIIVQWDRLLNVQTVALRLDLWATSLRLWQDHFLTGSGPGLYFWTYPAYLPPGMPIEANQLHPHNIWLEVATTWGLLGFLWLLVLLGMIVRQSRDPRTLPLRRFWLAAGLIAALAAAAAHAQTDAFFLLADLAGWNALALALVVGLTAADRAAG